jgi:hypothetical protein
LVHRLLDLVRWVKEYAGDKAGPFLLNGKVEFKNPAVLGRINDFAYSDEIVHGQLLSIKDSLISICYEGVKTVVFKYFV